MYKLTSKQQSLAGHEKEEAFKANARLMPDPDVTPEEFKEAVRAMDERRKRCK
jgi:hypothetical protein